MTWFRVGGAGIPAALKNAMNAVFNKKFGTSGQNYPPNQWPDDVNLMGPLPEGTASGSIANISDGADQVPIKLWNCTVDNSDGISSVLCTKSGKNLLPDTNYMTNYFSVADNGVVSQITTGAPYAWSYANCIFKTTLPAGTYTAIEELVTDVTNASHGVQVFRSSDVRITSVSGGVKTAGRYSSTFTLSEKTDIGIVCKLYDGTAKLYIVSGSSASSYEPYSASQYTVSLGRTIYGGSLEFINGAGTDENGVNFTFDPISPIPETKNVCNFWTNVGASSVVYRRDIDLALQALSSSRGLMMASRAAEPMIGEESDPEQVNELVQNDGELFPEQLYEVVENNEKEQEGENNAR